MSVKAFPHPASGPGNVDQDRAGPQLLQTAEPARLRRIETRPNTDPRNAEAGNPALLPEQLIGQLGFRYKGNAFTLANTLYYRYEYDAFTELRQSLGDNTTAYDYRKPECAAIGWARNRAELQFVCQKQYQSYRQCFSPDHRCN